LPCFKAYVDKLIELGIEENCVRYGEPCVAGIEMGSEAKRRGVAGAETGENDEIIALYAI
jgi:hypothetical protein